ncbi:MAG TPA: c-type cytochrome [Dissulfurispiraceae bacterium]|nr:c-type cytochrome [Dissulfurispiraceae bacterium]
MKRILSVSAAAVAMCILIAGGSMAEEKKNAKKISGEAEFKKHCAVCHLDGGNVINPAKTLHAKDLKANGVKKASDVVAKMRNPGPGMTKFDKETVPDKEAKAIAAYVMKTFK